MAPGFPLWTSPARAMPAGSARWPWAPPVPGRYPRRWRRYRPK